jgi:hypothetical protein
MYANRPGYYLPERGPLRHAHQIGTSNPEWHEASNPHPATPTSHADTCAFDPNHVVWARANANLSSSIKAALIREAHYDWLTRLIARNDIPTPLHPVLKEEDIVTY